MWIEVSLKNINFKKICGFVDIHTKDLNLYSRKDPKDVYCFNFEERIGKPRADLASVPIQQCVSLNATLEQENDTLILVCMISLKNIIQPNDSTYEKVIELFQNSSNEREFLEEFNTDYAQETATQDQEVVLESKVELAKLKGSLKPRQRIAISRIAVEWTDCVIISNQHKRFKIITNSEKRLSFLPEKAYERSIKSLIENSYRTKLANETVFLFKDPKATDQDRKSKLLRLEAEEKRREEQERKEEGKEEEERRRKEGIWKELRSQSDHLQKANSLMERSFNINSREKDLFSKDLHFMKEENTQKRKSTNPFLPQGYTEKTKLEDNYSTIEDITRFPNFDTSKPPPQYKTKYRDNEDSRQSYSGSTDSTSSYMQREGNREKGMQNQGGILGQRIEQLKNLLEQSWASKDKIERERNSYSKRLFDLTKDFDSLLQENKQQSYQIKEFKIRANQIIDKKEDDIEKLRKEVNCFENQANKRESELEEICKAYDNLEKRNLDTVTELHQAHQYVEELTGQISSLSDQLKSQEPGHPSMNQTSEPSNNPQTFMPRCSSTPLPVPQKVVDQQISTQLLKEGQKILNKFRQRRFSDPSSLSWDDEDLPKGEPKYENTGSQQEESRGEREKSQRLQEIDNLIRKQTANLVTSNYNLRPRNQLQIPERYKL